MILPGAMRFPPSICDLLITEFVDDTTNQNMHGIDQSISYTGSIDSSGYEAAYHNVIFSPASNNWKGDAADEDEDQHFVLNMVALACDDFK